MSINDVKGSSEEMSFTDMMNDINEMRNDSDDEDDDIKYVKIRFIVLIFSIFLFV
jgi:hypothetical protein